MDDNRTMAQLLEAPTEGYEDAIVVPEITANNFEIKHGLLNLVQNKQFFGHDKEDPHAHIRYFNKITSTMKFPNEPSGVSKVRQSRSKAIVSKVSTSSSTPAVSSDIAELKDMVRALILDKKNQTPAPAPVKAVEQSCHDDQSVNLQIVILRHSPTISLNRFNRVDVIDIACEEYVQEVLEISESGNPTSTSDLMIDSRSPSFTPFGGSDFLMEEIDEFLEPYDSIPPSC
ncbi:hypothetical protein Tco_0205093 [Tanacetum coccineum]